MEKTIKHVNREGNEWAEIEISVKDGRLSICGSYGRIITRSLDIHTQGDNKLYLTEGAGQCIDTIEKDFPDFPNIGRIKAIWERWHLNDMRAGCEHQEEILRSDPKLPRKYTELTQLAAFKACPSCGYSYGSAWKKEELPDSIIKELEAL